MRTAFKVPLQSEVEVYVKEKMGWPDTFVKHYSEKFWNHYQASGWKLSSGNSIKDWKACFNSQWKVPKYKEDIEMLYGKQTEKSNISVHTSVKPTPPKPVNMIQELDQFLQKYQDRPTDIPFSEFGKYYDYMKAEKLIKPFTVGEVENLKRIYNNDNLKCRCACVQITMDGYVNSGFTFGKVFELRLKLA
jgi:hypothetical protein